MDLMKLFLVGFSILLGLAVTHAVFKAIDEEFSPVPIFSDEEMEQVCIEEGIPLDEAQ